MAAPGYEVGQIPPVPLFDLPDLSLLYARDDAFTLKFTDVANKYPGLTLSPVACDDSGSRIGSDGAVLAYGDSGSSYSDADGVTQTHTDGSGVKLGDGEILQVNADGSGSYVGPAAVITVNGDGSGSYFGGGVDAGLVVSLDGRGAGDYSGPLGVITVNGDGSGRLVGRVIITVNADGSGSYMGNGLTIDNDGHGTATVVGSEGVVEVAADPLAPVPALGKFPSLGALEPQNFCGVSMSVDATLLFDFGAAELRPDAAAVVATLAQALTDNNVPAATVEGHTDSISDDAFNQTLSENRAGAVAAALRGQGVTTQLDVVGYGKTRPVAPNTNADGSDNPAGRQLNRRVEVFIPIF